MNRDGHLITSLIFLAVIQTILLTFLLIEYGGLQVFGAGIISIGAFLFGVLAPDLDHPAVQKKFHIKFLGKVTTHRGRFHSITGVLVYSILIGIPIFFVLEFWYVPTIVGGMGYLSHLVEDQAMTIYKKTNSKNVLRFI